MTSTPEQSQFKTYLWPVLVVGLLAIHATLMLVGLTLASGGGVSIAHPDDVVGYSTGPSPNMPAEGQR